jgi:hypothetical protein
MGKTVKIVFVIGFLGLCSIFVTRALPVSKSTVVVVDETGKPVEGAKVRIGLVPGSSGDTSSSGTTGSDGAYCAVGMSIESIAFVVNKEGYYESAGGFRFASNSMGVWRPWNPQIKVVQRKVVNPVPMYARDTIMSDMVMPVAGKPVGFDLITLDWLPPYGKGKHPDFIFLLKRNYIDDNNFRCRLELKFSNHDDGIQEVESKYPYSAFRLDRTAPTDGYTSCLEHAVTNSSNDFNPRANYFFRVRSKVVEGKVRGMYGKIHGDVTFDPRGTKTAWVSFKYYLNPDFSNNLEYDNKHNLFTNIRSYQGLSSP